MESHYGFLATHERHELAARAAARFRQVYASEHGLQIFFDEEERELKRAFGIADAVRQTYLREGIDSGLRDASHLGTPVPVDWQTEQIVRDLVPEHTELYTEACGRADLANIVLIT